MMKDADNLKTCSRTLLYEVMIMQRFTKSTESTRNLQGYHSEHGTYNLNTNNKYLELVDS